MLSVNYLPDHLFSDFPFDPKSVEPNNYDSVIPQWNSKLSDNQPEFIFNGILGPESIAVARNGLVYTGLADGRLVELDPRRKYQARQVLRFKESPNCVDNIATRSRECGRFLQLRFLNDTLYALESYTGLYEIDIRTGKKSLVGPKSSNRVNLFNSFAFDPKEPNIVYITVSSTKWDLHTIVWSIFERDSTGQILALDIKSRKSVVIVDGLLTPNGIDVDVKRDRLVFSQTVLGEIGSINLEQVRTQFKNAEDGSRLKNVLKSALIPLVPGCPDNIIIEGDIAYIALPFVKPNGNDLVDHLSTMPTVKKAYARLVYGLGKILEYICKNVYHHTTLEIAYQEIMSGHINYSIIKTDKSAVIEYNLSTGTSRFLGSNTFGFLSEAVPDGDGNLLLGSFRSPFIVKVKV